MGIEELENEIIQNAENDASAIIKQAEQEAVKLQKEYNEEAENKRKKHDEALKMEAEQISKIALSRAQTEANKHLFDRKKEILNEVFEKASVKLRNMNEKEKKKLYHDAFKKVSRDIDINIIYCNTKDASLFSQKTKTDNNISFGFIVENKEGTKQQDFTLSTILEEVRPKLMHKLADKLF